MTQLVDILIEKKKECGSFAEIGKRLGDISGQLIGKYASGTEAPLEIAIKWKKAFNENLIDLMFEEERSIVAEPVAIYGEVAALKDELLQCHRELHELHKKLDECQVIRFEYEKKFSTGRKLTKH